MASAIAETYDIVIAGGGMIGSALAIALAPLGLQVAVVEPVARGRAQQPSFDDRSTALSRSSRRMFEAMGLWQEVDAASTPIASIHVSDRGRFGFAHIDAAEQAVDALGHVVINRVLGEVLRRRTAAIGGLDWICPGRVTGVETASDGAVIDLAGEGGERKLVCRLLVAADGANSAVRGMLGIGASRIDYRQTAIIGNLLPEIAPANRAFERFTDTGALALLPIAERRAAFVWVLPADEAAQVQSLPDASVLEQLQATFGYRLGRFSKIGGRAAYPLMLTRAARLIAPRSVLVGNAAHGLHPVAAQGFNLGMRDVAALCDVIADARSASPDPDGIGSENVLRRYADWRASDHRKVVWFTHGLVRLFGSRRPSFRAARSLGMLAFDFLPGVRGTFARHTMGLAGRLPRLSRGVPLTEA
ncbi:MAG TPA: 2-octaprenyl-6-methoxyphenyl hydroxylase [Woeseiaceae bacterium]|nr:2-octaprenyl-6-methoxyphenyl hydroxylase [Woeseiaceae bacterium]